MSDSKLTIERAVTGIELPRGEPIACADCGAPLREGQPVTAEADHAGVWRPGECWCPTCAPRPSEVDADRLAEADIGIIADARNQRHYSVLVRVTVVEELVRA